MSKNKTIAYIIGHRNSNDPNRLKNLLFILKWLTTLKQILTLHNIVLKIVVVEQDDSPKIEGLYNPSIVTHIFAYNPDLFNRGWGFNVGFKAIRADYYFFADNDIILEVNDIINVFLKCFKYEAVKPYSKIFDSTKEYIDQILFDPIKFDQILEKNNEKWKHLFPQRKYTCFSGGIVGLSRKSVFVVSGWDERFRGRGWEDYAFTAKLKLFLYKRFTFNYTALHLWHEFEDQSTQKINYELNKQYQKYDVHNYIKQIETSRNFGSSLKYSFFGKNIPDISSKYVYCNRRKHAIKLYDDIYNWVTKKYHLEKNKRRLYTYLFLIGQLNNIDCSESGNVICESGNGSGNGSGCNCGCNESGNECNCKSGCKCGCN